MPALTRERLDAGIEVLRLDRPEVRNAMDSGMLAELDAALTELAADDGLTVLVVSTTDDQALCAGADVSEALDRAAGVARMEGFARLYAAIEAFPAPTIAVCVGNVVGAGAELATACDLRVAGGNLKLMFPGARLGVPIGPARLVPLIGLSKARELIFTGRVVGAQEAERLGLLAASVPTADAESAAIALARQLAMHPPAGMRQLKGLFREFEDLAARTERENGEVVEFQRSGAGVPQGGVRGR